MKIKFINVDCKISVENPHLGIEANQINVSLVQEMIMR